MKNNQRKVLTIILILLILILVGMLVILGILVVNKRMNSSNNNRIEASREKDDDNDDEKGIDSDSDFSSGDEKDDSKDESQGDSDMQLTPEEEWNALSNNEKVDLALSAYQDILKNVPAESMDYPEFDDASFSLEDNLRKLGDHREYYDLYDVDDDGVPELFTWRWINFRWFQVFVYTMDAGEASLVHVQDVSGDDTPTFDDQATAMGGYYSYVCPSGHVHNVWDPSMWSMGNVPDGVELIEEAYVFDGKEFYSVNCSYTNDDHIRFFGDTAKDNVESNWNNLRWPE